MRFSALTALQRIWLHHQRPVSVGDVQVRKWMLSDEVWKRYESISGADKQRVASQVTSTLEERVLGDAGEQPLLHAYVTLQTLGLVDYRTENVDPITYTTPMQEEVRISQLASPRPRPHLRVADARDPSRLFGYVYRNERGAYVLDFAESPGADTAVETLTAVLESRIREVAIADEKTVRNPDGSAKWLETLDLRTAEPPTVLRSLRVFVERHYHVELVS